MSDRLEQIQQRVAAARERVRETMTIKELSQDSINSIVREVSQTQDALDAVFESSSAELGTETKYLKGELKKLLEDGKKASKEELVEIRERAEAILDLAGEADTEESKYLAESASSTLQALIGIKKHAAIKDGDSGTHLGGIFSGLFGSKVGGWLAGSGPMFGAGGKKNVAASLELEVAEALEQDILGVDDDDVDEQVDDLTPSEKSVVVREKEKESATRTKVVVDLLEEIRDNQSAMMGSMGLVVVGGGGGGGDGDGDGEDGGGNVIMDLVSDPWSWILGASLFRGGGAAATTAGSAGGASLLTRLGPAGIAAAVVYMVWTDIENAWYKKTRRDSSGAMFGTRPTLDDAGGIIGITDAVTGIQLLGKDHANPVGQEDENIHQQLSRAELEVNENHYLGMLIKAKQAYMAGDDELGRDYLNFAQGRIEARAEIIRKIMPRDMAEAQDLFSMDSEVWGTGEAILNEMYGNTHWWEKGWISGADRTIVNNAMQYHHLLNPDFDKGAKINRTFRGKTDPNAYDWQEYGQKIMNQTERGGVDNEFTELRRKMGFFKGGIGDPRDSSNFWRTGELEFYPSDLQIKQGIPESRIDSSNIYDKGIQQENQRRRNNTGGGGGAVGGSHPPLLSLGAYSNTRNEYTSNYMMEMEYDGNYINRDRSDLFTRANYDLRV